MKKPKTIIFLGFIFIIGGIFLFLDGQNYSNSMDTVAGQRCGGNMANAPVCATGYHCAPKPGSHLPFGDVGGICVKN